MGYATHPKKYYEILFLKMWLRSWTFMEGMHMNSIYTSFNKILKRLYVKKT
jgi:hypothetical protein